MTITIDAELEARLRAKAALLGEDPNRYAVAVLAEALEQNEDPDADLTDEDKARMHEGILRGLADEAAGRVKPLTQVIDEARKRHGFPESWPHAK